MEPDLLDQLLDWVRGRFFGKYRGVVTDNNDPTSRGRLKVKAPAVLGDLEVWALPCVPYAGDGVGFYSLPEPETAIWVEFEGGDPSYPIWAGCFWGDDELPDPGGATVKIWKTGKLTVRADDDGEELKLVRDGGATVTLTDEAVTEAGGNKHSVDSQAVTSKAGSSTCEVSTSSFSVNDGALEVM
jgi:uncharacterized protein involved in type VI secretion and phage assembly